ncbi:MAG: Crp/Fnr family transcriptional regulator [Bacteroidota bacterium]
MISSANIYHMEMVGNGGSQPNSIFELFITGKTTTYKANDYVFREGDLCKKLMIVKRGRIKVGYYDPNGNECITHFCGEGDLLGQLALIGREHHVNFAMVVESGTEIMKIGLDKARRSIQGNPVISDQVNEHIIKHISRLNKRIEILFLSSIKSRVLEFIKDMAINYGEKYGNGVRITHGLTQSDIAAAIGSSRKTTSLILNELERNGIIRFDRKHIFIPDYQQLMND